MSQRFQPVTDAVEAEKLLHAGLLWYTSPSGARWVATRGFLMGSGIGFITLVADSRFGLLLED